MNEFYTQYISLLDVFIVIIVLNMSKNIKVVDRNLKVLGELKGIPGSDTVETLKKNLIKNIEAIKRRKIGTERVRLTIGDPRGVALADKKKTLNDYI